MDRSKQAIIYAVLVVVVGFTINAMGVVGYVGHVNAERDRAEQRAAAERSAAAEQTRKLICDLADGYARAFKESPPAPNSAGAGIRETWAALAVQFACPPSS